jgi:putative transposase
MPRVARQCPGGVIYHVLNRSVARISLFRSDKDFLAFEKTLLEALDRLAVEVLAYSIMPNHWHLVLRPHRDGDLSKFMQWLTLAHAQRWRTSHGTVGFGPLYQGRFKSFPIQCDDHLLVVLRYVERNALRAKLVSRAELWRWSSLYRRLSGTAQEREMLSKWPIDLPRNWIKLVNEPQTGAEEDAMRVSIYKSRPFGTPAWQRKVGKELGLVSCFRAVGRPKKTPK